MGKTRGYISMVDPWDQVYGSLASSLYWFYAKCKKDNLNPGKALYKKLTTSKSFVRENSWIEKFGKSYGVESVDPIHIFASLNASKSSIQSRTTKIKVLFRTLSEPNLYESFDKIDFNGCPAPNTVRILSVRPQEVQDQIWDLFLRVQSSGVKGLKQTDFQNISNWYGINVASLTIFLFWIKSEEFLPLEINVRTYIEASGLVNKSPEDYESYVKLLAQLSSKNYSSNSIYGSKGIFRELTLVAYNTVTKKISKHKYSKELMSLLKLERVSSKSRSSINKKSENITEREKNISDRINLGFKIVALKLLKGYNKDYKNILKSNEIYYFENTFSITHSKVLYNPQQHFRHYELNNESKLPKININAIVGKNGSGKSTVVEFIYRLINNLTYKHKILLKTNDIQKIPNLGASLYYIIRGSLFCLTVKGNVARLQKFEFKESAFVKKGKERAFSFGDFNSFFYTVAINYSLYALNAQDVGDWLNEVFHKNDAYQAPLVINPMRIDGNININIENELVKSRLMSLLFLPVESKNELGIRQLAEEQKAIDVNFAFIEDKNKSLYSVDDDKGTRGYLPLSQLKTSTRFILSAVSKVFEVERLNTNLTNNLEIEAKNYIIRKLVRIAYYYEHYKIFYDSNRAKFNENKFNTYLNLLKDDKSHITYKLRQAINFIKYPKLLPRRRSFKLNIESYSGIYSNFIAQHPDISLIELLPPSIFKPRIIVADKTGKRSGFEHLSSGEKQIIYSVASILYHLVNLDSVKQGLIQYKNINLVLDEIELYYHPNLQRKYIDYLLRLISRLPLSNIEGVNITLITHSPYILSDLPATNILKLKSGKPEPVADRNETLGANIHDLLANDFFLEEGYMGEFAKKKINELISFLETKIKSKTVTEKSEGWTEIESRNFIRLIGEPVIAESLFELHSQAFYKTNKDVDAMIDYLLTLKQKDKN